MAFNEAPIDELLRDFEERARTQRRFGQRVLWVILGLVFLSITVFYYAPIIAGAESSNPNPLSTDNSVLVEHYKYIAKKELSHIGMTLAIRVSLVVTLLFFIQILWGLYRYYMRLSTYYGSRADGLRLVLSHLHRPDGLPNVGELIGLFSPSVDFGRSPASTPQAAVALAKTLIESIQPTR